MRHFMRFILVSLFLLSPQVWAQDAAILPPAKTTFVDGNGKPYNGGKVFFYIPGTDTLKSTWQDADKNVLNANPVILDAAGRAIIYGDGEYRQVLKDRNNNQIWDQLTTSTGSGGGSTATGDGDLVGTIKPWAGLTAPNQYLFTYGQEIVRATYPELFTAITLQQSVFCTLSSPVLTGLSDTTQISIGGSVEVICMPSGTTVISKTSTTITVTNNATISTSTTARFFPWGNGNGTTTFNLPDFRGKVLAGRPNMGGTSLANLTTTYYGTNPDALGADGGSQNKTLLQGNLPAFKPAITITDPTHSHNYDKFTNQVNITTGGNNAVQPGSSSVATTSVATGITAALTNNLGSDTPFSIIQPTITSNYIIKVTPDTNSASATGVLSLGGMTGVIACGSGLLCTGNTISATLGEGLSGYAIIGNGLGSPASFQGFTQAGVGASTRTWQDKARDIVSVKDFGAVGDNVTNNTVAFNTAVAAALANNAALYVPCGKYVITATITITAPLNIYGDGPSCSIIRYTSATGNVIVFEYPSLANGGGINDITIESGAGWVSGGYQGAGTSGVCLAISNANVIFKVHNVIIANCGYGIDIRSSSGGTWGVDVNNFAILYFENNGVSIDAAGAPGGDRRFTNGIIINNGYTGVSTASVGIKLFQSGGDFFKNIDITSTAIGVYLVPNSGACVCYSFFDSVLADSTLYNAWEIDGSVGTIQSANFVNIWGAFSSGGSGLRTVGSGINSLTFVAPRLRENAHHGWSHEGGNNIIMADALIAQNSQDLTLTYNGINVAANVGSFTVTNSRIGNIASTLPGNQLNNIFIAAGTGDNIILTGNNLNDFGAGGAALSNGATGTSNIISNNIPTTVNVFPSIATNTILGNATSGTAAATALSIGSCSSSASALTWTTNSGFGCNTAIAAPAGSLTGTTLAANVVSTSITSTGTLMSLAVSGTTANTIALTSTGTSNISALSSTITRSTTVGTGGIFTGITLTTNDNGTTAALSNQAFRLLFNSSATAASSAYDAGVVINPTYNESGTAWYGVNLVGPVVASGKTLAASTGIIIGPPSGAGSVTTKVAIDAITGSGRIQAFDGFQAGGNNGLSATKTVRDSAGSGTCTLIFTGGILTGGTC